MAKLEIYKYPNPVLKQVTNNVTEFNSALHKFLDDMSETMYVANGVGLAAPQVGDLRRITVIDVSDERKNLIEFINPQITHREGATTHEEGCLSIPDYREHVDRNAIVHVSAVDRHGKAFEVQAEGLLAICLQHEIDHLDGILFIDRLSRLKKEIFRRWYKKQQGNS